MRALCVALVASSLVASLVQAYAPEDSFDLPAPAAGVPLRLSATYYHVHSARESAGGVPLVDLQRRPISAPLAPIDWCRGARQGTIRVLGADGAARVYGLAGTATEMLVDCSALVRDYGAWVAGLGRNRFQPSRGAYGVGESGAHLVPFRTVAVDKRAIAYRSVLYIPAARGVPITLPSGRSARHDGFFFAADTGPSLQSAQIDVFLGVSSTNPFGFIGSNAARSFEAYLIPEPAIAARLAQVHSLR